MMWSRIDLSRRGQQERSRRTRHLVVSGTHSGRATATMADGRRARRHVLDVVGLVVVIGVFAGAVGWRMAGAAPGGSSATVVEPAQSASPSPGGASRASAPAAASPSPSPVPGMLPLTQDRPVPSNLRPTLGAAPRDYPEPYLDGCHVQQGRAPGPATCLYGNAASRTTIVLFGDSHALSWFPAVQRLANQQGWRLLNLTMSACSPATITQWNANLKRIYTECATWRRSVIARLVREHPQIVLVAGTRGFSAVDASGAPLVGEARTLAWRAGMELTLKPLVAAVRNVIVIGDTPLSLVDPPTCLRAHPQSVLACATPVARAIDEAWLGEERAAAARAGAGFIDPSSWVCPTTPCPVVIGRFLAFRNPGHLTATFAATLYKRLGAAIKRDITTISQTAQPSVTP